MSTLKVINLQHPSSSNNNVVFDANGNMTVAGTVVGGSPTGMRNRIINGAMLIDQRNAGAAVTLATSGSGFPVDRFKFAKDTASGSITGQQSSTAPANFTNSLYLTVGTAFIPASGDGFVIQQRIEGFNTADLAWGTANAKTVTLSFWVRSSLTGSFSGALSNSALNYSYPFTYTISAANTWEYKTITIAGPTAGTWIGATNGIGMYVLWDLGSGSTLRGTAGSWAGSGLFGVTGSVSLAGTLNSNIYITGVQLEAGTIATPFEYRQYGHELSLCQRYFQTTYDPGTAVGTATRTGLVGGTTATYTGTWYAISGSFNLPVPMRATPTVSYWDGAGNVGKYSYVVNSTWTDNAAAVGTAATFALTSRSAFFSGTTGAVAPWSIYVHYGASAEL